MEHAMVIVSPLRRSVLHTMIRSQLMEVSQRQGYINAYSIDTDKISDPMF